MRSIFRVSRYVLGLVEVVKTFMGASQNVTLPYLSGIDEAGTCHRNGQLRK